MSPESSFKRQASECGFDARAGLLLPAPPVSQLLNDLIDALQTHLVVWAPIREHAKS
jgi:hypothetical protein